LNHLKHLLHPSSDWRWKQTAPRRRCLPTKRRGIIFQKPAVFNVTCMKSEIENVCKSDTKNIWLPVYWLHLIGAWLFFSPLVQQPPVGRGHLNIEASRSHSDTPQSIRLLRWGGGGGVNSPSHRPLPDNTQHLQETDVHAFGQDSNPQSQQASGCRPIS
jgi:hypothetical protein